MAIPAKKTSKSKKKKRRTYQKLALPSISFDSKTATFKRNHHISLKAYRANIKQLTENN